jgi:hypothetical protein
MNLGEILDRAVQTYRRRFLLFATLSAFPALAMMGLQVANDFWWKITPAKYGRRIFLGLTPQGLVYTVALYQVALLLRLLAWPAFAYLTSRLYFEEQPTLASAFFWCVARWRSWLWMSVASWGIVLVLPEVATAAPVIGIVYLLEEVIKLDDSVMTQLGPQMFLAAIALGWVAFLWLSAAFSLAIPSWTLDNLPVGKSLRRSWTLSRGSRWRIIFARFMPACVGWLLNFSLSFVLFLLVAFVMKGINAWSYSYRNIYEGIVLLSAAAASTLTGPIFPIALTLFYYDQRIRHEGYDVERMMEAAGLNAPVTSPSGDGPIAPARAEEGQA